MKKIFPAAVFALLAFIACKSSQKMNSNQLPKNFDTQGHRGCRGLLPENTLPAMMHALAMGVVTLEMDVVMSKDGKVLLSHEPFFNHEISTGPDGQDINKSNEKQHNIFSITYDEVARYDVGLKPHPRFPSQQKMAAVKPLLSAVFDSVKAYMITARRPFPYFNIETKTQPATDNIFHPAPQAFVEALMKIIIEKEMQEYVIIQSFDFRTLQYLHKHYPAIKTALLIEADDKRSIDEQLQTLGFIPNIYSPAHQLVNTTLVSYCHNKQMKIIPWTVNDKKRMDELIAMDVDGIISDYPNLFFLK